MSNTVKPIWLYLSHTDIETERRQCEEEGRDLSLVEAEFDRVLALDLEDLSNQSAAQDLLDKTIQLPIRADYAYHEPDGLEEIRAARSSTRIELPALDLDDATLLDKLHGAWAGRCVGCLLGKPVEGWHRPKMWNYLKSLGRWPLNDFFLYDIVPPDEREKYDLHHAWADVFADRVAHMVEDDDTNYTTTGFAILKKHGRDFTPSDVANFWLNQIPIIHTCTAERIAYRNFCNLLSPPASASFRNPYREWIGAQIRADFFGYACAGNPELAAEFAWRDASISHVKNGIYGEMWCAAMIAAAFVTSDISTIIQAGLDQIPQRCRLAEDIRLVIEWKEEGIDYDAAVERLHARWDETKAHHWCHTISNAMVVAIGLLWGESDFGKTICRAVQPCFDTDCNGATTGSILGIMHGRKALPEVWAGHIHDTLHTGVAGYHVVKLEEMARQSVEIVRQVSAQ
jgi:ADP-ribosylglycohydrolase